MDIFYYYLIYYLVLVLAIFASNHIVDSDPKYDYCVKLLLAALCMLPTPLHAIVWFMIIGGFLCHDELRKVFGTGHRYMPTAIPFMWIYYRWYQLNTPNWRAIIREDELLVARRAAPPPQGFWTDNFGPDKIATNRILLAWDRDAARFKREYVPVKPACK